MGWEGEIDGSSRMLVDSLDADLPGFGVEKHLEVGLERFDSPPRFSEDESILSLDKAKYTVAKEVRETFFDDYLGRDLFDAEMPMALEPASGAPLAGLMAARKPMSAATTSPRPSPSASCRSLPAG